MFSIQQRDLPFLMMFCLGYLDLYPGKADLCVCYAYMVPNLLYLIFYDWFFRCYMDQHQILWELKKKQNTIIVFFILLLVLEIAITLIVGTKM